MNVLGIDPGAHTGLAIFRDGELSELRTIAPVEIDEFLTTWTPKRVVFEDSRLESKVWTPAKGAAALKVARNIGEIDAWCKLIVSICARLKIDAHGISPKSKGTKLDAKQFEAATGWTGASNQHTRDAAMVAYKYRRAA